MNYAPLPSAPAKGTSVAVPTTTKLATKQEQQQSASSYVQKPQQQSAGTYVQKPGRDHKGSAHDTLALVRETRTHLPPWGSWCGTGCGRPRPPPGGTRAPTRPWTTHLPPGGGCQATCASHRGGTACDCHPRPRPRDRCRRRGAAGAQGPGHQRRGGLGRWLGGLGVAGSGHDQGDALSITL